MTQAQLGRAMVIVVSTRAAAGERDDTTGPIIVGELKKLGFSVYPRVVVPDNDGVQSALETALSIKPSLVITTGGTGLSPTDRTPEVTEPFLSQSLPWLSAAIVQRGISKGTPLAVLSRGLAGVSGKTLVINLPGSIGGVRDGLEILREVLPHAVAQIAGEDHPG